MGPHATERSVPRQPETRQMKSEKGFQAIYPSLRDFNPKSVDKWLEGKRIDDNIDGNLWRVHDKLYDLNGFIVKHPGGRFWLERTKGMDVTEAFESTHLNPKVWNVLEKHYVREAKKPRNSPYTFKEDGFYRVLKKKIWPIIQEVGAGPTLRMLLMTDGMVLLYFLTLISACFRYSHLMAIIAGTLLALIAATAHNFFHHADNFRMYYFDLSPLVSQDWRISHVLSHHVYTNTLYDFEISMFEPFIFFLPDPKKSRFVRLISPVVVTLFLLVAFYLNIIINVITLVRGYKKFHWSQLILLVEYLLMVGTSGSIADGTKLFLTLISSCSVVFLFIGITAAHHHPEIYHTADTFREDPDWGLCQLDAVRDRFEITGSLFLASISFGDHSLHHLFPTIDQSKLHLLYPVFLEHCKEFGINFTFVKYKSLILGMYRQAANATPNLSAPGFRNRPEDVLLPNSVLRAVDDDKRKKK